MTSERLTKIDVFFAHVGAMLEKTSINPTNVSEVKKEFFTKAHNPIFSYKSYPLELDSLLAVLEVMQFKQNTIEKIYSQKRDQLIREIKVKKAIGTSQITKYASRLYPKPGKKLIRIAKQILSLPITPKDDRILRKDAVQILKQTIREFRIDWKVTSKKLVASANVNSVNKKIEVNKGERFGKNYIQRLAIHEIGTHVLRGANGELQPYNLFQTGLEGYLETEEGLAAYNEFRYGFMTNTSLRNYAGRILAIHYALENDFQRTFKKLRKYFDKNIAFKLTVRAKRGLSGTSQVGGYTKDSVYLRGFLRVLTFAKKNDVSLLYTGKIGIEHVPLLKNIRGLKKPAYLPHSILEKEIVQPGKLQIDKKEVLKLLK